LINGFAPGGSSRPRPATRSTPDLAAANAQCETGLERTGDGSMCQLIGVKTSRSKPKISRAF
jgi:hypothetical protein